MRELKIQLNYIKNADSSVLISLGDTQVICSATLEKGIPKFLKGKNKGWVNAEYSLLPTSTNTRVPRESVRGKLTGRTMEISRLISRSLRAAVDLEKLGEYSITIDCDVINADGGTRTTAITGAFVALYNLFEKMIDDKKIIENPIKFFISAISVGIVEDKLESDLNFELDSKAQVDMNIVMNEHGDFIEIQGTAEEKVFNYSELENILKLAKTDIASIIKIQKEILNV